jgi:hypothetical protein
MSIKLLTILSLVYLSSSISIHSQAKAQAQANAQANTQTETETQAQTETETQAQTTVDEFTGDNLCDSVYTLFKSGAITEANANNYANLSDENYFNTIRSAAQDSQTCTIFNSSFERRLTNLSNHELCQSNKRSYIAYFFLFKFCVATGESIRVKSYHDFSYGGLALDNGRVAQRRTDDKTFDENQPYFDFTTYAAYGNGFKRIEIMGAEKCCDGGNKFLFSRNGGAFKEYNIDEQRRECKRLGVQVDTGYAQLMGIYS